MILRTILGDSVGVVHTSNVGAASTDLVGGVIVGRFKRGRLYRPFLVTQDTIKAKLKYDPHNPDYQAVQDALDVSDGAWVMRIPSVNLGGGVFPDRPWLWNDGKSVLWKDGQYLKLED